MQQIFNFILKNSHRLLVLLLLGISIGLTIQYHAFHGIKIISSANFVSGNAYKKINEVESYFSLRTQNNNLAVENARLKMLLFNKKDTILPVINDLQGILKTNIILSKVIHNSYDVYENFLTIDSGANQGVKPDMGVINDLGIVGIIDNTSSNFATVISILNKKNPINAKIKKSNHFGSLSWNGKSTGFVQLIDVPRLASVRKGDTIVTGGQSVIFPENINIGTIDKIYIDNETNYYTLNVKLFNDMTNLGHVYIIKNRDTPEIKKLEETILQKNE
ncbi:MAG: rod shape-determining protein MreC [Flavobacterium sp.]|nr:rod shape-determining protein MreC [Flavobacterium sp.]